MVPHEHKLVCVAQWPDAGGKSNLASLVDNAIVEAATMEQSAVCQLPEVLRSCTH